MASADNPAGPQTGMQSQKNLCVQSVWFTATNLEQNKSFCRFGILSKSRTAISGKKKKKEITLFLENDEIEETLLISYFYSSYWILLVTAPEFLIN